MSRFPVNPPLWWNSNECQVPQSLPKNLSLKEPSAQLCHDAKQLGLQVQDRDSSSTQSTGQSYHEVTAMGDASSQDQCISSESVQDERYGKSQLKQVIFPRNPDHVFNPSQVDYCYQMTHFPYPYAGPHFGGFMTAYGPQAAIQPQMVGIPPARVPLPADLVECGPIYVNAKQYNGIMRRRQSRAKLEAQNKLIKARKPYLHESRHLHALNRVRGSGGRFLSSKKLQHPDSTPTAGSNCVSDSVHLHQRANISQFKVDQTERKNPVTAITSCSDITSFPSNSVIYWQPDGRFSGITSRMVGTTMQGGGMCGGTQHRAPVVR